MTIQDNLKSRNAGFYRGEENNCQSSEELEEGEKEEQKGRRRRRKRKPTLHGQSVQDGEARASESSTGQSEAHAGEGGERLSRNKRRKLKKKRHKEKLLSMGLVPRAAALEFTYQRAGGDEEDEDKRRAAEVSDFLRTTMEIYMSDRSLHADNLPLMSAAVDDLLSSMARGHVPASVLRQLHGLKTLVQQKQPDRLAKALEELHNTSSMSSEETTAVASLFQYWITDILPMQGDMRTGPSPTQTQDCESD